MERIPDSFIIETITEAKAQVSNVLDQVMAKHFPTELHKNVKGLKVVTLRNRSPSPGKESADLYNWMPPLADTPRKDVRNICVEESEIEEEMRELGIFHDLNSTI